MEKHNQVVADIALQVRRFHEQGVPFRISHGSTNSTRRRIWSQSGSNQTVDVSSLSRVIKIDRRRQTALVEPNVPMDRLVDTTLRFGLVPPVVMEFPGITVGGGFSGTCGESSSFRHGFFDATLNWVEMVLGNGEVVKASPNGEHSDLFHGAAGAVGTLGITTLVELRLIAAKSFVETKYHPVRSLREAIDTIQTATQSNTVDYVDGIIYSESQGVVITGKMTDVAPYNKRIQRFSHARDPWFYLHARDAAFKYQDGPSPATQLIPLDEYLFRYDRGGFWVGLSALQYFFVPFTWLVRWFFDDFLRTRMMYRALHASGHARQYVVQDLALPMDTAEEFIKYTTESFGIFPLWLCPLRESKKPTFHPHALKETDSTNSKQLLNVGLWGLGTQDRSPFLRANRHLEKTLRELGGAKWLYATTYYTPEEFWSIYGRKWYETLREKYHAKSLPNVYDKVHTDAGAEVRAERESWAVWITSIWPFSGVWGVWNALLSKEFLLSRRSWWAWAAPSLDAVEVV